MLSFKLAATHLVLEGINNLTVLAPFFCAPKLSLLAASPLYLSISCWYTCYPSAVSCCCPLMRQVYQQHHIFLQKIGKNITWSNKVNSFYKKLFVPKAQQNVATTHLSGKGWMYTLMEQSFNCCLGNSLITLHYTKQVFKGKFCGLLNFYMFDSH